MRRLAAVLALAAFAAGCGASGEPEGAATVAASAPRSEIAGETLDGEQLSLADFRGRPVLVNVWSSW